MRRKPPTKSALNKILNVELELPCLHAAYLLAGKEAPPATILLSQQRQLEGSEQTKDNIPNSVKDLFIRLRLIADAEPKTLLLRNITSSDIETESTLISLQYIALAEFCEQEGIVLSEELQKKIEMATAYKNNFSSDSVFRINTLIAYYSQNTPDVSPRCLSEPLWGLAEACHIVMGTVTPSRFNNNRARQLEKDAYDYCVKGEFDVQEESQSIRYLYDYARMAIARLRGGLIAANSREEHNRVFHEVEPLVFLEWCHREGIYLRDGLSKLITKTKRELEEYAVSDNVSVKKTRGREGHVKPILMHYNERITKRKRSSNYSEEIECLLSWAKQYNYPVKQATLEKHLTKALFNAKRPIPIKE